MVRYFLLFISPCIASFGQASFHEVSANQSIFNTTNSRGVSVIDFDNDGDDDIYVCSGSTASNKLFRNNGNFSFSEIAKEAGLEGNRSSRLSVWFDADNDGWLDVYLGGVSENTFFRNNRNGTFTELTITSGLLSIYSPGALLVGDLNGDQWLDVYSNNFSGANQLFLNYGDTKFRNRINGLGAESAKNSMGGFLFDQDLDGDLDIYLVFDGDNNYFFKNDGTGKFKEAGSELGLNVKANGMGADFADFNHDGKPDIYVTNLFSNSLLMAYPDGTYKNEGAAFGVNDNGMGWGTVSLDYDNDTYSDIYMVNDYSFSPFPNRLFRNNQGNLFTNVTSAALECRKNSYGVATGDFDQNGWIDIVVGNNFGGGIQVFKNAESLPNNWIELNLVGTSSNKFAVGSLVKVKANGMELQDQITTGSGYGSQNSYTLHFGTSTSNSVEEVSIRWPDGSIDLYKNLVANKRYLAIESESINEFNVATYQAALNRSSTLAIKTPPAEEFFNNQFHSVARKWNEAMISAIRSDLARPTVHARNLFHFSIAVYDAWASFDDQASTFLLNKKNGDFFAPFSTFPKPTDLERARKECISYAAFRLLMHRFNKSPGASRSIPNFQLLFKQLGYEESFISTDYSSGSAAALGNYIASKVIEFGLQDGSNEANGYVNQYYQPVNQVLRPDLSGSQNMVDCNKWQPLKLQIFVDQNGNVQGTTPPFLSPEWGKVTPFALTEKELKKLNRNGGEYWVYHDPGPPPLLDPVNSSGLSAEYKWGFSLVSIWASHLDPADKVMIDISPASKGNLSTSDYPKTVLDYRNFYKLIEGGDNGKGYAVNPKSGQAYQQQIVPRGDYTRVLAEFWADGPNSETPPGHWFSLLNYVSSHPSFEKKFNGVGNKMDDLEWDVKSYLTMGGALHDVAITAWGIKGYYDGVRPISAIRFMADKGQSSDQSKPNYHPSGIPLMPGYVELVLPGDSLAGNNNENINKVKLYTWRGPNYIADPEVDHAGVGWILAENWYPYQRPSFVTPPFAGYISGHSTYSSAGAEVLTLLTGNEYFPGGMGEFVAKQNQYLVFEKGPSVDIKLQWARYKDASDQSSLSRIWGGIHPPADDIPGRVIGKQIGTSAYAKAVTYFENSITAISENEQNELTVFPNPSRSMDKITIQRKGEELAQLKIFDQMGRVVMDTEFKGKSYELDLSSLATGLYILRIYDNGVYVAKKILIQ
jgi:ASPIC and UnbV/FG-GAP-like repeat/Secretion system C-terminal sorting domain